MSSVLVNTSATSRMADFASRITAAILPDEVKRRLLLNTADTIGVALGSADLPHVRSASDFARSVAPVGPATVWASGFQSSVTEAAFANGFMSHACDFDDAHKFVHPGCVVVPAVFALAESRETSGAETLAALAAGYEVVVRVGLAAGRLHRSRHFHPTGTCGVFGAAAGAARLLNFSPEQLAHTFGLAASLASGISRYRLDGSANKHLHAGAAARNGVMAALLTEQGLQGASDVMEAKLGFLETFSDTSSVDLLVNGLGDEYRLLESDIKPYPSCRQSHGAIELALSIAQQKSLTPSEIKSVKIATYTYACQPWYVDDTPPDTWLEAILRIPYCVAVCLATGKMDLESFSAAKLSNPAIRTLLPRIQIEVDPQLDAYWPNKRPLRMSVELESGELIYRELDDLPGSVSRPLSKEFIAAKFASLVEKANLKVSDHHLFNSILEMETLPNVEMLVRNLSVAKTL